MGTLGCINDMMRRDKENRELRKQNRARMQDTHQRLFRAKLVFLLAFLAVGILVWLVIWFL